MQIFSCPFPNANLSSLGESALAPSPFFFWTFSEEGTGREQTYFLGQGSICVQIGKKFSCWWGGGEFCLLGIIWKLNRDKSLSR